MGERGAVEKVASRYCLIFCCCSANWAGEQLWEAYNPDGAVSFEGSEYRGLPVPHPSHPFSHIKFFDDMEVPLLGKVVAAEARAVSRDRGMQKVGVMTAMYQAAIFLESPFDLNLFAATDSCLCGDYLPFMFGLLVSDAPLSRMKSKKTKNMGIFYFDIADKYNLRNLTCIVNSILSTHILFRRDACDRYARQKIIISDRKKWVEM
jgi:hypothetical protein